MKGFTSLFTVVAITLLVSACLTTQGNTGNKQMIGTVVGGALGGVGGSFIGKGKGNIMAIIAGTMLGAAGGNQAGLSLDRADQLTAQANANTALEYKPNGSTTSWSNPNTRASGTVTPTRTGTDQRTGEPCRQYTQTVTIDNQTETVYGTACRVRGRWEVRNASEPTVQQSRYQPWNG